jgi:hypothetical protein
MENVVVRRLCQHRLQQRRDRNHQLCAGGWIGLRAAVRRARGNLSAVTALAGNSCNPDYSFFQVGSRTQWNPVPRLDIGLDVTYTGLNTAYKGAAVYAVNGSRPAVALLDDQGVWSAMFRWQRNFYP